MADKKGKALTGADAVEVIEKSAKSKKKEVETAEKAIVKASTIEHELTPEQHANWQRIKLDVINKKQSTGVSQRTAKRIFKSQIN